MFFLKYRRLAVLAAVLVAGGCAGELPVIVPGTPAVDRALIDERAAELARTTAPCAVRGLGLNLDRLRQPYLIDPDRAVRHIKNCGFNRIHLYVRSTDLLAYPELENLLAAAGRGGIGVEIILRQRDFIVGHRGNWLVRNFVSGGESLADVAAELMEYQSDHPDLPPFDGITVMAEPHVFTAGNTRRPQKLLYFWSEETFGAGNDNDMLVRYTLDEIAKVKQVIGDLRLTVGVPDFYHELVAAGKLTKGDVADFLSVGDRVMLVNSGNKPSELLEGAATELASAPPHSVIIGIRIAEHTSRGSGVLRRRNWGDFTGALEHAIGNWSGYPAFDGVVIAPFALIQQLMEEP